MKSRCSHSTFSDQPTCFCFLKLLLVVTLLLVVPLTPFAQIKQWIQHYNGGSIAQAIAAKDGGYLLGLDATGEPNGFGRIVKVDKNGMKQWGLPGDNSMAAAQDGGYVFGRFGSSWNCRVYPPPPYPPLPAEQLVLAIKKTDSSGNLQWTKSFPASCSTKFTGSYRPLYYCQVAAAQDGGFFLASTGYSEQDSCYKYWIIKVDSNGNTQWNKMFGGKGGQGKVTDMYLYTVAATQDGGLLVAGSTSVSGKTGDKSVEGQGVWVAKISAGGQKQWDKVFSDCSSNSCVPFIEPSRWYTKLCALSDGNYMLGFQSSNGVQGDKTPNTKGGLDYWIIKINAGGSKLWDKDFGTVNDDFLTSLTATNDGGCLLKGTITSGSDLKPTGDKTEKDLPGRSAWIIKIDKDGKKRWDRTISEEGPIFNSPDSSYVVVSQTGLVKLGKSRKCGSEGCKDFPTSNFYLPDPETGNVQRQVRDLEVSGGVGQVPLVWTRYWNSRGGDYNGSFKAQGQAWHNWVHNYQYDMQEAEVDSLGRRIVQIHFPEGEQNYFIMVDPLQKLWQPLDSGINKQLFQKGNEFTLQTADGFRYRFEELTVNINTSLKNYTYFQLQDFRDPSQNVYKLTYNDTTRKLVRVTDPGKRFLDITYDTKSANKAISKVTTSDGRSVQYHYNSSSNDKYDTTGYLDSVIYDDGTKATYTYKYPTAINKSEPPFTYEMLLETAIDPRGIDHLTNIKYSYLTDSYLNTMGVLNEIRNGADAAKILVSLDTTSINKTLTYANGAKEVYQMSPLQQGQVQSYTNGLKSKTEYEYHADGLGFLKSSKDALGRTLTYTLVSNYGNPIKITYPDGTSESWTRDDLDLVMTYTNQLGQKTTYSRDAQHRPTRIDYFDNSYETFTNYNDFGQAADHRRRNGGIEHYNYNIRGLLESFINAERDSIAYTYDKSDRLQTVTDARGNTTKYEYNERGLITKTTHPGGSFQEYKYDDFGNRTKVINELGKTWVTTYDEFRRPKNITDPLQHSTDYFYELPGGKCCSYTEDKPSKIKLPSGKQTTMAYDAEWNMTRETAGAGSSDEAPTEHRYDSTGRKVLTIDPLGKQWKTDYDVMDRVASQADPLKESAWYWYDAIGRIDSMKRADNGITDYEYDDKKRIKKVTVKNSNDPKKQITEMVYDAEGNMVKQIDPNTNEYVYEFDKLNRRRKTTYPGGVSFEKYDYDKAGNLVSFTNRAGKFITNTYDHRNRLKSEIWNDTLTPPVTYFYDSASRVVRLSNPVSAIGYTYNDANELVSDTQTVAGASSAKVVGHTYNEDGLPKTLKYPDGKEISYGYTGRNQVASIQENGNTIVSYTYNPNGNRIIKSMENGTTTKYTYDDANRLLSVDNQVNCASFNRFDYGYDNVDRLKYTVRNNEKGDAFTYNAADQLTDVKYIVSNPDGSPGPAERTVHYDLDAGGNRSQVTDNGKVTSYKANNLNQYTQIGDTTLEYTANGSLKASDGWTNKYDAYDRMIQTKNDSTTINISYDPAGRAVKKTVNGKETFACYNGIEKLEESSIEDTSSAVSKSLNQGNFVDTPKIIKVQFLQGAELNEVLKETFPSQTAYLHEDGQGKIVMATDDKGSVIEQYQSDIYGDEPLILNENGKVVPLSKLSQLERFYGRGLETLPKNSRLYNLMGRVYDPKQGRYVNNPNAPRSTYNINNVYYDKGTYESSFKENENLTYKILFHPFFAISKILQAAEPYAPHGFYGYAGGTLEAQEMNVDPFEVAQGACAYTAGAGSGVFYDSDEGLTGGQFLLSGKFKSDYCRPDQFVLLGSAGVGIGPGITNAKNVHALLGPFDTWSLNTPVGSVSFAYSEGIWTLNAAVGPSGGLSISRYKTVTTLTTETGIKTQSDVHNPNSIHIP